MFPINLENKEASNQTLNVDVNITISPQSDISFNQKNNQTYSSFISTASLRTCLPSPHEEQIPKSKKKKKRKVNR